MTPREYVRPGRDEYLRVRVTPDVLAALERIAAEDGATVSELVRRVVAAEIRRRAPRASPSGAP